jgi:hypothetical protein
MTSANGGQPVKQKFGMLRNPMAVEFGSGPRGAKQHSKLSLISS